MRSTPASAGAGGELPTLRQAGGEWSPPSCWAAKNLLATSSESLCGLSHTRRRLQIVSAS